MDNSFNRMIELMKYGQSSSNSNVSNAIEKTANGADGKVYGIIREGINFYIKFTDSGKENLLESFNYIGGWDNRKDYRYNGYNEALKHLEMKLVSLNEAYDKKTNTNLIDLDKKENAVIENTSKMQKEIARQRQIMNNVMCINEGKTIDASNIGVPEAPKSIAIKKEKKEPFTDKASEQVKLDNMDSAPQTKKCNCKKENKIKPSEINEDINIEDEVESDVPNYDEENPNEELLYDELEPDEEDIEIADDIDDEDIEITDDMDTMPIVGNPQLGESIKRIVKKVIKEAFEEKHLTVGDLKAEMREFLDRFSTRKVNAQGNEVRVMLPDMVTPENYSQIESEYQSIEMDYFDILDEMRETSPEKVDKIKSVWKVFSDFYLDLVKKFDDEIDMVNDDYEKEKLEREIEMADRREDVDINNFYNK